MPKTNLPSPAFIKIAPVPAAVLDGRPPLPNDLKAECRPQIKDAFRSNTIMIFNISSKVLSLPVSRDGKKAYDICPDREFIVSSFSRLVNSEAGTKNVLFGELYGCDAFKGSMITVKPNEGIEVGGVADITPLTYGASAAVFYEVFEMRLSGAEDALLSTVAIKISIPVQARDAESPAK